MDHRGWEQWTLLLAGLCLAAAPVRAAETPCTVGAAQARAQAVKQGEKIIYGQSGTAWCPDSIPVLVTMLDDTTFQARSQAASALRDATWSQDLRVASGPHLPAIAAAIKRMAASKLMSDWGAAVMLHDVMGRLGKDAVPHLIEALGWEKVRLSAASTLRRIGAPASAALPALRAALKDEKDTNTADTLRAAIERIGGK